MELNANSLLVAGVILYAVTLKINEIVPVNLIFSSITGNHIVAYSRLLATLFGRVLQFSLGYQRAGHSKLKLMRVVVVTCQQQSLPEFFNWICRMVTVPCSLQYLAINGQLGASALFAVCVAKLSIENSSEMDKTNLL